MKFFVLIGIVIFAESRTIPSHPNYLSVKLAKTNELFTILKKSTMNNEGYPTWKTPDNKYVNSSCMISIIYIFSGP